MPSVLVIQWILIGFACGAVTSALLTMRTLKRRAEERREAERRATQAERLAELGSMTSGLAHEIRNPLSTVKLNAQLLREGIDDAVADDEERERLDRRADALVREAERLREILEDFLQFAGRMNLDAQRMDVRAVVDGVADFFDPQCIQSRVLLRTDLPPSPVHAEIDETLFKQALLNLLINALQAMEEAADPEAPRAGELLIRLREEDDDVVLHVIDSGPGIDPDRAEEIFRPYVTKKRGGSGLGLPTTRRIVEEHGGTIEVHSVLGSGSDFVIRLPRTRGGGGRGTVAGD